MIDRLDQIRSDQIRLGQARLNRQIDRQTDRQIDGYIDRQVKQGKATKATHPQKATEATKPAWKKKTKQKQPLVIIMTAHK